jgi:hypothetical protein
MNTFSLFGDQTAILQFGDELGLLISFTGILVIVLIRSFLGITFEMEVDGHWPWERRKYRK